MCRLVGVQDNGALGDLNMRITRSSWLAVTGVPVGGKRVGVFASSGVVEFDSE